MNDRRPLIAMVLIVAIAYVPLVLLRKWNAAKDGAAIVAAAPGATAPVTDSLAGGTPPAAAVTVPDSAAVAATILPPAPMAPEDTVVVRSPLYRYAISTHGARIVGTRFLRYRSLEQTTKADTLDLLPKGGSLFGTRIALGNDTLRLDQIAFTASTDSVDLGGGPATLTLHGTSGPYAVELVWHFVPTDFHFDVTGTVSGLGSIGGTATIDLGNGFGDTEANVKENQRESGIVTKLDKTSLKRFSAFTPLQAEVLDGPFEWVAVKSKYFVAGLFAQDSGVVGGTGGRVSAARIFPADTLPEKTKPVRAHVSVSLSVPASGVFGYRVYLGPMEYDRLAGMGHDFDDVNPYGFAFIRPIVRPIAVGIRALFLWMHTSLGIGFGLVIVLFGIMVRILLWPLNQKAMRSITGMQAIQPELQAIQERYKEEPARLQQEMFKLYKEHGVNPFGGCWPMLLPYPLLISVFFVLQNTIELRGVSFLWMVDLSRADALYIIPVLMAVSMFGISYISQRGMPPNPQAKMMMYMMPAVFLVMFSNFASGLNLYYLVQNLAQIPQQMLINRERRALQQRQNGGKSSTGGKVEIRTKK